MNRLPKSDDDLEPRIAANLLEVLIRAGLILILAIICYQVFSRGRRTGNFRGDTEKVPSPEPSSTKFARRRPQSAKSYTKGGPGCFTGSCRLEGSGIRSNI
jgi:hypothetical protein